MHAYPTLTLGKISYPVNGCLYKTEQQGVGNQVDHAAMYQRVGS